MKFGKASVADDRLPCHFADELRVDFDNELKALLFVLIFRGDLPCMMIKTIPLDEADQMVAAMQEAIASLRDGEKEATD